MSVFTTTVAEQFAWAVLDQLLEAGWRGNFVVDGDARRVVLRAEITEEAMMKSGVEDAWRAAKWPRVKVLRRRLMVGKHRWVTTKMVVG